MPNEIKKKVEHHGSGLLGMLAGLFGKFLSPVLRLIGPAMSILGKIAGVIPQLLKFLGPAAAVAAAGYAGYKVGQWINEKTHDSDKIVSALRDSKDMEQAGATASAVSAGLGNVINNNNDKLKGTGFRQVNATSFVDDAGKTYTHATLPPEIRSKISTINNTIQRATNVATPSPVAVQAAASSARVEAASAENVTVKNSKESSTVVNNITNNKTMTVPSARATEQNINIMTRNPEGTVGSYVASLFNHPVVRLPM